MGFQLTGQYPSYGRAGDALLRTLDLARETRALFPTTHRLHSDTGSQFFESLELRLDSYTTPESHNHI